MAKSKLVKEKKHESERSIIKKLFEYYIMANTQASISIICEKVVHPWVDPALEAGFGVKLFGYKSSKADLHKSIPQNQWTIRDELSSNIGRRFRTNASVLGRIRNLETCEIFQKASILNKLILFLNTEDKLYFNDLRRLMRYIYGITDSELYVLLYQLYLNSKICIISNNDDNGKPIAPFIIQSANTNLDVQSFQLQNMSACADYLSNIMNGAPKTQSFDLFYYNIVNNNSTITGNNTRFSCNDPNCDLIFVRMFNSVEDSLDAPDASDEDIPQHAALKKYFLQNGIEPLDNCYPYLMELLTIKTGTDVSLFPSQTNSDELARIVLMYKKYRSDHRSQIERAKDTTNNEFDCYYDFSKPDSFDEPYETATDDDIRHAIELVNANQDILRKDRKTGKVINAEKIIFIMNEIPEIYSLKSLYKIFEAFDTEPEVVRRDIKKLEEKKQIIKVKRGLYCSVDYAETHAKKSYLTLEAMFSDDENDTSPDDKTDSEE